MGLPARVRKSIVVSRYFPEASRRCKLPLPGGRRTYCASLPSSCQPVNFVIIMRLISLSAQVGCDITEGCCTKTGSLPLKEEKSSVKPSTEQLDAPLSPEIHTNNGNNKSRSKM